MPILKKKEPSAEPVTFRYHYSALRAADGWSEEPVWPDWTPALERPHNPTENAKTFTLEMEMGSDDTVFDKAPGTETTEAQKKAKAAKAAETAQATLIALQTKETQRKLAEEQAERARKMQDEASDFKARILERGKSLLLQRQATEISDDAEALARLLDSFSRKLGRFDHETQSHDPTKGSEPLPEVNYLPSVRNTTSGEDLDDPIGAILTLRIRNAVESVKEPDECFLRQTAAGVCDLDATIRYADKARSNCKKKSNARPACPALTIGSNGFTEKRRKTDFDQIKTWESPLFERPMFVPLLATKSTAPSPIAATNPIVAAPAPSLRKELEPTPISIPRQASKKPKVFGKEEVKRSVADMGQEVVKVVLEKQKSLDRKKTEMRSRPVQEDIIELPESPVSPEPPQEIEAMEVEICPNPAVKSISDLPAISAPPPSPASTGSEATAVVTPKTASSVDKLSIDNVPPISSLIPLSPRRKRTPSDPVPVVLGVPGTMAEARSMPSLNQIKPAPAENNSLARPTAANKSNRTIFGKRSLMDRAVEEEEEPPIEVAELSGYLPTALRKEIPEPAQPFEQLPGKPLDIVTIERGIRVDQPVESIEEVRDSRGGMWSRFKRSRESSTWSLTPEEKGGGMLSRFFGRRDREDSSSGSILEPAESRLFPSLASGLGEKRTSGAVHGAVGGTDILDDAGVPCVFAGVEIRVRIAVQAGVLELVDSDHGKDNPALRQFPVPARNLIRATVTHRTVAKVYRQEGDGKVSKLKFDLGSQTRAESFVARCNAHLSPYGHPKAVWALVAKEKAAEKILEGMAPVLECAGSELKMLKGSDALDKLPAGVPDVLILLCDEEMTLKALRKFNGPGTAYEKLPAEGPNAALAIVKDRPVCTTWVLDLDWRQ